MTEVRVTDQAVRDLAEMEAVLALPPDTRDRMRAHLRLLETSPRMGRPLDGTDRRFVLGSWRWMLVVYRHDPATDVVAVLTMQDARHATSPRNR